MEKEMEAGIIWWFMGSQGSGVWCAGSQGLELCISRRHFPRMTIPPPLAGLLLIDLNKVSIRRRADYLLCTHSMVT